MNVPRGTVCQPTIGATNCHALGLELGKHLKAVHESHAYSENGFRPMAIALRKTLAVATLALTASFLPATAARAADTATASPRTPGLYCLANAWQTPNVSTKPCDSKDPGQHWVIFNDQISLAVA